MLYNGFHLMFQERVAMGLIVQCTEFFNQHGTTVYPTDKSFHGASWCDIRTVKGGQFGLGVRANIKHLFEL